MKMKIAVASDLHLEFTGIDLRNTENADVLVLSGDICVADDLYRVAAPDPYGAPGSMKKFTHRMLNAQKYRAFFNMVNEEFPHVIYVAGNHEFYEGKWIDTIRVLRTEMESYKNIHFLERDFVKIDDVTFVGGTLWTDMNRGDPLTQHAIRDMMNDFRLIRHDGLGYTALRPSHTITRHVETLGYIEEIVQREPEGKFVVVGHHAPCELSIGPNYKSQSLMNGAYYSDLSEFILDRPQIKLWTHGHMHDPFDYLVGDTRVVCNPRGYTSPNKEETFSLKYLEI